MQCSTKWIQNQSHYFQRNNAEERVIAGLAKNDGSVPFPLRQSNEAFADITFNRRAIGQTKCHSTRGLQAKVAPHILGHKCILSTAVDQKLQRSSLAIVAHFTLDVGYSHDAIIGSTPWLSISIPPPAHPRANRCQRSTHLRVCRSSARARRSRCAPWRW